MASEYTVERQVHFAEADAAGVVHFSNFFRYMEECEHAFLTSLGCDVWGGHDQTLWPRVDAQCSFMSPLPVCASFSMRLLIAEITDKTIRYQFQCTHAGRIAAVGHLTVLAAHIDEEEGRVRACPLPTALRSQISCVDDGELYGE